MTEQEIERVRQEAKAAGRAEALEELGEALKGLAAQLAGLDMASTMRALRSVAERLETGLLELKLRDGDLNAAATLYESWRDGDPNADQEEKIH